MAIQIGRFSFRGPFENLDEIKDRPGIFVIHEGDSEINPCMISETPFLRTTIEKELKSKNLKLGVENKHFVSVCNTFCALALDRQEMVKEIADYYK